MAHGRPSLSIEGGEIPSIGGRAGLSRLSRCGKQSYGRFSAIHSMDKPGLAELFTAPLILMERTKGWKRRALACLYLVIALLVGAYGWHSLCLWPLPGAPEPFDLAKYGRVEVAD